MVWTALKFPVYTLGKALVAGRRQSLINLLNVSPSKHLQECFFSFFFFFFCNIFFYFLNYLQLKTEKTIS